MYNTPYCTLNDIATQIGLDNAPAEGLIDVNAQQIVAESNNATRQQFKQAILTASSIIDSTMERYFAPFFSTERITPDMKNSGRYGNELTMPYDLLEVESVLDASGAVTLDSTYYTKETPAQYLYTKWEEGHYWNFPNNYSAISITGWWGYHNNYANAYQEAGKTQSIIDGVTQPLYSFTVADASKFAVFDILRIEDELMLVQNVDTVNNELTVDRAINGTAIAEHAADISILRYNVIVRVNQECRRLAVRAYQFRNGVALTGGEQPREMRIGPPNLPYHREVL